MIPDGKIALGAAVVGALLLTSRKARAAQAPPAAAVFTPDLTQPSAPGIRLPTPRTGQPSASGGPEAPFDVQITTVRDPLRVRARPDTSSSVVGHVAKGATVRVDSTVRGEVVLGSNVWYHLADGSGYISGAYAAKI